MEEDASHESDEEIEETAKIVENEDELMDSLSSDDSSDDDEAVAARTAEIERLEKQIVANNYEYQPHVSLIKLLQLEGDLEKLRFARQRMSKVFPLTEELWLDWVRDEMKVAFTDEEKQSVCDLFESAVKDYLSTEIWLEYCQFSIGLMAQEDGIEKCRNVFEKAVTAAGIHLERGAILWEAYREYENVILATLQQGPENEDEIAKQTARIVGIFKRQLSVPLIEMEKTWEELKDFVEDKVDHTIEMGYKKALAKLQKLLPFEKKLISSDAPHSAAYEDYIAFEIKEGEPARVQCTFERAVVENCLNPEFWIKYVQYLDGQLKIDTVVIPVYERAVRNCPWSVSLWQGYLRALERYHHPKEKIKDVAEKALAAGFTSAEEFRQLWLTYLEYLRRQIPWDGEHEEVLETLRGTFERAHNYLLEYFGVESDPCQSILQFWARVEARHCKNMDKAREIWNDIMQMGYAKQAQMWLEFISLERLYGDVEHARKLFSRAIQAVSDWPESIGEAWFNLERDEGTLEQWGFAVAKYEARMKIVQERRQKEAAKHSDKSESSKPTNRKQKTMISLSDSFVAEGDSAKQQRKKRKFEGSAGASTSTANLDADGFTVPAAETAPKPRKIPEESPAEAKRARTDESTKHGVNVVHDSGKDERTVFVSNLAFDADDGKIRPIFAELGEITDLRLVRDYRGRSKGYCYVEFASWDCALEALKKDREKIDGRPIFVSKCRDKTKSRGSQQKFKYTTGLEKCKLFIKGLPFSTTEDELTNIFQPYGDLVEVRLVTYRNGHSKGIAYVEYKDEASAATALLKTDGTTIGSQTITVAISNPPERKPQQGAKDELSFLTSSLGGGSRDGAARARGGRSRVALLPRAISKAVPAKPAVAVAKNGSAPNGSGDASKTMSNDDFRAMLLKN